MRKRFHWAAFTLWFLAIFAPAQARGWRLDLSASTFQVERPLTAASVPSPRLA